MGPVHNDCHLFKMLTLEGARARRSWEIILKMCQAYHEAFHYFDSIKLGSMSDHNLDSLLQNKKICQKK